MQFTDQHKAILLTFLISGTVVLSIFNLGLKQQNKLASESYYEIEPEKELTEEELKVLEALDKHNKIKAETNQAYNESNKDKHFAQAYETIAPPEDYVPNTEHTTQNTNIVRKAYELPENSKLNREELANFSKVNDLLKQQQSGGENSKSSIKFSLPDRKKVYIPIPVYLCEVDGEIVINITVNTIGKVIDAYLNTSSTSNNACLIEHALEYAKKSRFSHDASKKTQIGSITFSFIGKN
ncbi:hypothetical protein [uncultured Algibacter sp.]|uniref:hypothetical protein n=1 Tax=uncultured Algibacter sp. TaxID=298659 RepID=UPI003217FEA7